MAHLFQVNVVLLQKAIWFSSLGTTMIFVSRLFLCRLELDQNKQKGFFLLKIYASDLMFQHNLTLIIEHCQMCDPRNNA